MQVFRAHADSKIRHLALTPWGDLWTGSSSGTIRIWNYPSGALGEGLQPMLGALRTLGTQRWLCLTVAFLLWWLWELDRGG